MSNWEFGYGEAESGNPTVNLTGLELVGLDEDLNTFSLPADVDITDFTKTVLDDTSANAVKTTLGINDAFKAVADDSEKTDYGRGFSNPVGIAVYQVDTARAYICVSST